MIKWLWAKLTGGRLVLLRDADGEVTLAIARRDPWGDLRAERWWPCHIRSVRLLPNGKVDGGLYGCYVEAWIDASSAGANNAPCN